MSVWSGFKSFFSRSFGYSTPHRPPNTYEAEASWNPPLRSTDGDIMGARPYIEARVKDLVQTNGFLAGASETDCNHVVGDGLVLSHQPDWETLGKTEEWADEFSEETERRWNLYIGSSRCWHDASGKHNWAAFCRQAWKTWQHTGEIAAVHKDRKDSPYRSSVMLIDPNRIKTPVTQVGNLEDVKDGIRIDRSGKVVSYFIYDRNPLERAIHSKQDRNDFKEIKAYSRTGRKRVLHHFDPVGAEQTRGISKFAPAVESIKRTAALDEATLKAAIYQTLIAVVLKSSLNYEEAMAVLGGKQQNGKSNMSLLDGVTEYMKGHYSYYNEMNLQFKGLQAVHLMPNEDLEVKQSGIASSEYGEFSKSMRKESARAAGQHLAGYDGDYSQLSFSGGMLAVGEDERGYLGVRTRVLSPFCQDIFELWFEAEMIRDPNFGGDINFYEFRDALCRSRWIGPPPLNADPEKMAKAAETRLNNRISTREYEMAALGIDWRLGFKQQKREQELMDAYELKNAKLEEIAMSQEEPEDSGDGRAGSKE